MRSTFELDGLHRPLAVVAGLLLVPFGVGLLLVGDEASAVPIGVLFTAMGGLVVFKYGFWQPHRVTMDDSGILLEAVVRRIRISWDDLEAVAPSPWDLYGESLKWRRRRGRPITTLKAFPELHTMLVEIERQAPHAYVSS